MKWFKYLTCTCHSACLIYGETVSRTGDGSDKLEIQNVMEREKNERGVEHTRR